MNEIKFSNNESEHITFPREYPLKELMEPIFEYRRHEFEDLPDRQQWCQWCYEYSSMSRKQYDKSHGTTLFAAYFHPYCINKERYENLAKCQIMFFVLDDHCDRDSDSDDEKNKRKIVWQQFAEMLDRLENKEYISMSGWKPYITAFYIVLDNILSKYNDIQRKRCINLWRIFMQGNAEEVEARFEDQNITLDRMIEIRRKSNGVYPTFQNNEYADDIFVEEDDWNESKLQKLFELVSDDITFINDIFSFETEYYKHKDLRKFFSTVAITILEKKCSVLEAFEIVKGYWQKNNEEILKLLDAIRKDNCSENKKLFAERLVLATGGNHKCSTVIDRYNKYIKLDLNDDDFIPHD